jgi:hypothetical protein
VRQFNGSVCLEKVQWQRLVLILALLPALLALNSCGKGSASAATSTPTLTISCNPTSVTVNGTATCTQSITNLSSTLVNWQAGGVVGGNSTFGTIDTNGKYTAPQTVPTSNVVTITAIAQAQTSLTATATITILPATAISAITCLDANSAPSLTVKSGTSLACTATSSANTTIPVFWQVNTIPGGNAAIGKINAQGNYVAPLVPAAGGTVTITAISQAVSTQTMSVTVNVTFGNRVLSGSYAFSASGQLQATNGFFSRVGSFIADGNGGLTGLEDVNPQPAIVTSEPISFSGSYSIGPDGRGTMQFCEPASGNACAVPTSLFRVVVISPQQAQIIDFQTSSAASGEIVAQPDISVFKTGGLIGGYTFSFSGISSGTTEESVVGEFVSDGAGKITSGELDTNIGGTPTSQVAILNTSTYTIDSRGRGTAKLITSGGTSNFDFYMVSASRAKFLQTDASPVLAGDSFKQQSINPWAPSSLNGNLVLQASGTNSAGAFLADVGTFATDGSGTITAGSGLLDQNSGGAVTSPPPYGGTYTVDLLGRGTITIPNHTYVLYMISAGNAVLQETTGSTVAHGILTQPQGSPSLNGNYGLALAGQNASKQEEDIVGQLSVNSTGNVTAAALDINNFGALTTGQTAIGTYTTVVGGRTTVLLNPTRNLVLYFVSPTQAYALDTDTTGAAIGSLDKQF